MGFLVISSLDAATDGLELGFSLINRDPSYSSFKLRSPAWHRCLSPSWTFHPMHPFFILLPLNSLRMSVLLSIFNPPPCAFLQFEAPSLEEANSMASENLPLHFPIQYLIGVRKLKSRGNSFEPVLTSYAHTNLGPRRRAIVSASDKLLIWWISHLTWFGNCFLTSSWACRSC